MAEDGKRNQILDEALGVFARFGLKKTTVSDVAERVGMTKGNLYHYFENKRDLYEETVGRALLRWRDTVAGEVDATDDVVEKLEVMSRRSLEHLSADRCVGAGVADDVGSDRGQSSLGVGSHGVVES